MFLCPQKSNNSKKNHYLCKVLYFIVKSRGARPIMLLLLKKYKPRRGVRPQTGASASGKSNTHQQNSVGVKDQRRKQNLSKFIYI